MKKSTAYLCMLMLLGLGVVTGVGIQAASATDPTIVLQTEHFAGGSHLTPSAGDGADLRTLIARLSNRITDLVGGVNGVNGVAATNSLNLLIDNYNLLLAHETLVRSVLNDLVAQYNLLRTHETAQLTQQNASIVDLGTWRGDINALFADVTALRGKLSDAGIAGGSWPAITSAALDAGTAVVIDAGANAAGVTVDAGTASALDAGLTIADGGAAIPALGITVK